MAEYTLGSPAACDGVGDPTPWRPRAANGDFHVGDRHFHLYARKCAHWLEELTYSVHMLTGYPSSKDGMSVVVAGHPVTDFIIEGNVLYVKHPDPLLMDALYGDTWDRTRRAWHDAGYAFAPQDVAQVIYPEQLEGTVSGSIITGICQESLTMGTGDIVYKPPCTECVRPPIVMTDDRIQPGNVRDFAVEFNVDVHDCLLTFNAERNYLIDPAFCAHPPDLFPQPVAWVRSGQAVLARIPDAYYGKYAALLMTGYYAQSTLIPAGTDMSLSAWHRNLASCLGYVDATPYLELDVYNAAGVIIQSHHQDMLSADGWARDYLNLTTPAAATSGVVRIGNVTGYALVDAVQLEANSEPTQFAFVSPDSTYEAERDPTGIYKYHSEDQYPFNFENINLNPVRTELSRGFLSLGEFADDWHNEPIGKGGYIRHPYPTGEFMVYRGSAEHPELAGVLTAFVEPPMCTGDTHFLNAYTRPAGQRLYALVNVGAVYEDMCEYYSPFTTPGGVVYPSGIQHESWVGEDVGYGSKIINLNSGYNEWLDVMRYHINTYVSPYPFNGICFEGVNHATGIFPQTAVPDQTQLMRSLMEDLWASYGAGMYLGLSDAEGIMHGCVTGTLMGHLDAILINGLTSRRDYTERTFLERNEVRTHVLDMMKGAASYFNVDDMDVYALDYMEIRPEEEFNRDTVNLGLIRASRHYAYQENWKYYWGPDTLTEIYTGDYGIEAELHNYGVDTGVVPPCTGVGRMHTPWAMLNGYRKLQQRGIFHQENRPVQDCLTMPRCAMEPQSIQPAAALSMHRGTSRMPVYYSIPEVAGWTFSAFELFGVEVGTNTGANGNLYGVCTYTAVPGMTRNVMRVQLFSDAATTQLVADGQALEAAAGYTVIVLKAQGGSGMTGMVCAISSSGANSVFTASIVDPWADRDTNDDIYADVHQGMSEMLQAVVRCRYGNPVDDEFVFMDVRTGEIDVMGRYTNKSGRTYVEYTAPSGILTGTLTGIPNYFDPDLADRVSFLVRDSILLEHLRINLIGSLATGIPTGIYTGYDVSRIGYGRIDYGRIS